MSLVDELREEGAEQETGNVGDGARAADLLRQAAEKISGLQGIIARNVIVADLLDVRDEDEVYEIHHAAEPYCDCPVCEERREPGTQHSDDCDCEDCDDRRGLVSYGESH